MYIKTALAFPEIVDKLRKSLERAGAFLCRKKIAALEHDLAVANDSLAALQRKADEAVREHAEKVEEVAVLRKELDRRAAYRHVLVHCANGVFALRRGFGEVPRLVCPVCFERGAVSDLCVSCRTVGRSPGARHEIAKVSCPAPACGFRFVCPPESVREAFKLAD